MSTGREDTNYLRLDPKDRTYYYDASIVYLQTAPNGSVSVGLAVAFKGSKLVGLAVDGDPIEGKLMKVESDGKCAVQSGGTNEFAPGTGAAVTPGKKACGAALAGAPGYVREVANATEGAASKTTIIGSETATAIILDLG